MPIEATSQLDTFFKRKRAVIETVERVDKQIVVEEKPLYGLAQHPSQRLGWRNVDLIADARRQIDDEVARVLFVCERRSLRPCCCTRQKDARIARLPDARRGQKPLLPVGHATQALEFQYLLSDKAGRCVKDLLEGL